MGAETEYPLAARGSDEVAEVTASFVRMRAGLQETQRKLIDSERLATIGRMAVPSRTNFATLAAIVANAEFLCDSDRQATRSARSLFTKCCGRDTR